MCPNDQAPPSWEATFAKLKHDVEEGNKATTDALQDIIETLEELKNKLCDLPPGCIPDVPG